MSVDDSIVRGPTKDGSMPKGIAYIKSIVVINIVSERAVRTRSMRSFDGNESVVPTDKSSLRCVKFII